MHVFTWICIYMDLRSQCLWENVCALLSFTACALANSEHCHSMYFQIGESHPCTRADLAVLPVHKEMTVASALLHFPGEIKQTTKHLTSGSLCSNSHHCVPIQHRDSTWVDVIPDQKQEIAEHKLSSFGCAKCSAETQPSRAPGLHCWDAVLGKKTWQKICLSRKMVNEMHSVQKESWFPPAVHPVCTLASLASHGRRAWCWYLAADQRLLEQ